jgi:pyridoxamine 5'-phosphate oxidase
LIDLDELDPDPIRSFQAVFERARAAGVEYPETMALATATPDGRPSARMVLLKGADGRGFAFYTNYESRKGGDLESNPRAALVLYWRELGVQVRVEGTVETLSRAESEAYFATRPRGAQLSAWVSPQSRPVADRGELEAAHAEAEERFRDGHIPLPPHWGGYLVVPDAIEFWQHREDRLHDRRRYTREGDAWRSERLAP